MGFGGGLPRLLVIAAITCQLITSTSSTPVVYEKLATNQKQQATALSEPVCVPFDYGWRFRLGHAPDGAPGPGDTNFTIIDGYGCSNMEHNPNRFTPHDCMLACAYNPDCMVWQHPGGNEKACYHGDASSRCSPQTKPQEALGGQRKAAPPVRTEYAFASQAYDDKAWEVVDAPHDFVVSGDFVNMTDTHHGFLPRNVSWYRKAFHLPEAFKGMHIYVHFEGVFHVAQVWVNGQYILLHNCGYTGFTVRLDNVTGLVYGAELINVIAVRADATFGSGHWYEGGGIYRRTHLVATNPTHFTHDGIFVSPEVDSAAKIIQVSAELETTGTAAVTGVVVHFYLVDVSGTVLVSNSATAINLEPDSVAVARVTLSAAVDVWSVQDPKLYTVNVAMEVSGVQVDRASITAGFRSTSWSSSGFKLNNNAFKLRGFSHHNSFTGVGVAIPDRIHLFRAQASRAVGGSFWRMSHNPYLPALYDFLDVLGVLTWDENRDYGMEYVIEMHDMVKRDRNHPSIVVWSYCNEYECQQVTNQTGLSFRAAAKALDPQRATAANGDTDGLDVQGKSHAGNNSFESFHQQFPDMPLVLSECCSCETQRLKRQATTTCMHLQNSPGLLPYVAGSIGVWTLFDYYGESHKWPSVTSSFGNFDLAGFPKPHAYWYVLNWLVLIDNSDHGRPPVATSSVTRILDLSHDIADQVSVLSSGASVELFVDGASKGKTPTPGTGEPTIVPVSSAECSFPHNMSGVHCHGLHAAAAAINAKECAAACCQEEQCQGWQFATKHGCWIGSIEESKCSAKDPAWAGGSRDSPKPFSFTNITAISLSAGNTVVGSHTLLYGGKAASIVLTLDVPSASTGTGSKLVLDGHDAALVRASVVDQNGIVLTNVSVDIAFQVVSGQGRLVGVGNGDNNCHQNAKSTHVPAYGGHARAIFQVSVDCVSDNRDYIAQIDVDHGPAKVEAGQCTSTDPIVIEASSQGLKAGQLAIAVSSSAEDLPIAVARESVTLESYPYLTDFQG